LYQAKYSGIESNYQWIFSKQNILSSKIRICVDCRGDYEWRGFDKWKIRINEVFFAVKEYQRLHTPINSATSDLERYFISLPERSEIYWKHFGDDDLNYNFRFLCFTQNMEEYLKIALNPEYESSYPHYHELRAELNWDKDRMIPNDQELTRWMQKHFNDYNNDYWFRIQSCEIFTNPKIFKRPTGYNEEWTYNTIYTKYTVIVHYSIPNGDWDEFDI
jgi:hypothetical protein